MTTLIKHRVNRRTDLTPLPKEFGVEIDLRSSVDSPGKIHLSHDPWTRGDDFDEWLGAFAKQGFCGPLILNTKEDGLESRALELLETHGIRNYFFLDTALPTLVKATSDENHPKFAARFSSFEPLELASRFKGRAEWLWVDCFGGVPPCEPKIFEELRGDFKLCLVSPELHTGDARGIEAFASLGRRVDAICTKVPDLWRPHLKEKTGSNT